MDPAMVTQALASVPAEINLIARNPERSCRVGGRRMVFAPGRRTAKRERLQEHGKHSGTLADYRDWVRCRRPST
jgi:trimethylamine:corrinoid methyltransferase-like protein